MGIGDEYHPLPWEKLSYDTGKGGYVVDVDRETLEGAPSYTDEATQIGTTAWSRNVYTYTVCTRSGTLFLRQNIFGRLGRRTGRPPCLDADLWVTHRQFAGPWPVCCYFHVMYGAHATR